MAENEKPEILRAANRVHVATRRLIEAPDDKAFVERAVTAVADLDSFIHQLKTFLQSRVNGERGTE